MRMLNKIVSWVFYRVLNWTCNNRLPTASRIVLNRVSSFFKTSMPSIQCSRTAFLVFSCRIDHFHCLWDFSSATQNFTMLRNSASPIDVMLFTQWFWTTTLKQCWSVENLNNVMIFSGNDVITFRCWPAFSCFFALSELRNMISVARYTFL